MAFEFAGQYGPELLLDPLTTRPLRSVAVSVLEADGAPLATLATLWTDRTKATTAPNPTAADANGNLSFFADPGPKKISVAGVVLFVTVPVDPTEADTGGAGEVTEAELDAAVLAHATDATAHPASEITFSAVGSVASTNLQAAVAEVASEAAAASALLIPLAEKGAASGVAPLNASGKIPASHIPALALTEPFIVGSQAAMLALSTAEIGDIAIRTDETKSYILSDLPASVLASWILLLTPSSGDVSSVNGLTGAVVLPDDGAAGVASLRTLGTGATQAAAGNDSRLTNARTPSGAAGGALAGTYPNPTFAVDMTDFGVDAALPAADSGPRWYYAIDTHRLFYSDGAVWTQVTPGGELGYAQITSNFVTTSTTGADVPGLSATANVRTRPISVEVFAVMQLTGATNQYVLLYIKEGATILQQSLLVIPTNGGYAEIAPKVRLVPSVGVHTYKVTALVQSQTGVVVASAGSPAFIRIVES